MEQEMKFCQSCGMPLNEHVSGTNADGSKNEDYCMYCFKDGKFLQDCTMDEMIEHCAQFVDEVNKGLPQPITKEEYIGQMKMYFPHLKRWRKELTISDDKMLENPALAGVKYLIAKMADTLPVAYISSVDEEGYPCTKAMLAPRVREGVKVFYFTTNTFSLRVAHYKANPKASIYFCDEKGFKGMMLRGTMEVLTDAKSKEMIWRDGDEQYYPGGVTDPNYCVLKFTATDGRFYSDFYPRSFVLHGYEETDRILLRPWLEEDAEVLFKYASDPDVGPRAGWPPHKSVEESREVIKNFFSNEDTWAIELKETSEIIGCIGVLRASVSNLEIAENECEVGYWIAKPYWGKGICTEALRLVIDYCFNVQNFTAIWGDYFPENLASGKVMEKCGFKDTGIETICPNLVVGADRPVKVMKLDRMKINE